MKQKLWDSLLQLLHKLEMPPLMQTTQNIAIEVFGEEVANDSLFTYRTMSFAINDGKGRIFVIYQNRKPGMVLRFLNTILHTGNMKNLSDRSILYYCLTELLGRYCGEKNLSK